MGYGNPYTGGYGQMYAPFIPPMQSGQAWQGSQQLQAPPSPTTPQDSGMIWVQGEAGAKAYMVAPQSSVVLWDSEDNVIYIKSADSNGMPCMRVFDYTERSFTAKNIGVSDADKYVTRDEFNALSARLEGMMRDASYMEGKNAE